MERASSPSRVATGQLLAFAVLVGLLAAATTGYRYGLGDTVVHLPEILRSLDAGFLANDFYLNVQDGFGPRFYYRLAVAALAEAVPLWTVYAAAFVLAVVAASVVTALAARDLAGSTLAAVVAVPLAMWTVPFDLADWPAIRTASGGRDTLTPNLFVEPLCFLVLWRGVRGRPMQAAAISVPAILLHPTFGLATVAVAIAAALGRLYRVSPGPVRRRGALSLAAGGTLVAVAAVGLWIAPGVLSGAIFDLDGGEVARLVALRHPHHLRPSTWPADDFLRPAVFLAAGVLALAAWGRPARPGEPAAGDAGTVRAIAIALLAVGCGVVCGTFFIEVVPTRWAAIAYPFRLQALAAWLCWIVLAAVVAEFLRGVWRQARASRPAWARRLAHPRLRWAGLLCLAVLLCALVARIALVELLPETSLAARMTRFLAVRQPIFTVREAGLRLRRRRPHEAGLAAAARSATPRDAVFLVPGNWQHWRLHAQRAVVYDWKAFPFRDRQMRAWHERVVAVSDLERGVGYPDRATERWLWKLAASYRFDYAVVPRSSCLSWPTIATSGPWKLVAVSP